MSRMAQSEVIVVRCQFAVFALSAVGRGVKVWRTVVVGDRVLCGSLSSNSAIGHGVESRGMVIVVDSGRDRVFRAYSATTKGCRVGLYSLVLEGC